LVDREIGRKWDVLVGIGVAENITIGQTNGTTFHRRR